MSNFGMSTRENFASFKDEATGQMVFVDSIDNREFNVRKGTMTRSHYLGTVTADSDEVLNRKLKDLVSSAS